MFYISQAQINFTLVICKFANMSILKENHQNFPKIAKNIKNGRMSTFFDFQKDPTNMPRVVWAKEPKTGLRYEIGPSQQKCQRKSVCNR